jgi:hypothetical protein
MGKEQQEVITFSFASILAVPNELGTDANKLLDHRLSKKDKKEKMSVWEKI